MRADADVIVVGGGVMGTAAARSLAERGRSTLLLERWSIGHDRGSSSGPTRIFRLAYHHPDYVRLARRALGAWRELESRVGQRLVHTTGGVDAGTASEVQAEAMAAAGVAFERTNAEGVAERWPALRLESGVPLFVQEDAGVCLVKPAIGAQVRLARGAGAEVREDTVAASIGVTGRGVEVVTADEEVVSAPIVVLAAGAWNGPLLRQVDIDVSLRPTFEQTVHCALTAPSPLPTLVDRTIDAVTPGYAVPDPRDARIVKVGRHLGRVPIDPDVLPRTVDEARLAADVAYAREWFPGAEPTSTVDTCLYTMTPDEDFVLERRGDVVVCSPCSGHGFKFAPLIGEAVADLVDGVPTSFPIERFLSSRPSVSSGSSAVS